ncbi:GntR family transcriptional regulator [Acuticoccus sp. M5D2P5]|uniref:GntR family transcriptional regulator n=1 Tax=Acuticoccus kalidii TaxID=2910977 RepID=UPI001F3316FA|nr:GntR family transcriptional regulator [Acuticoccus kalidii]MCF3933248.1 GntR family transcriptional regulator [Acuticoccus kalidii]
MTATDDIQDAEPDIDDPGDPPMPERVAALIREQILEDRLKPGMPVRERILAKALGVSRTPLREALKILSVEGLVDLTPRRGAVVAAPSPKEQRELLQLLGAIEGFAGTLACDAITEDAMKELRATHYEMLAAIMRGDRLTYFRHNQAIHRGIVEATGNGVLIAYHRQINLRLYRVRYVVNLRTERWESAIAEHEAILDALQAGDKPRIRTILEMHVLAAFDQMERDGKGDAPPTARP